MLGLLGFPCHEAKYVVTYLEKSEKNIKTREKEYKRKIKNKNQKTKKMKKKTLQNFKKQKTNTKGAVLGRFATGGVGQ